MSATTSSITIVQGPERMTFLPNHFGKAMLIVENMVYHVMRQLTDAYTGGNWEYGVTNNQAAVMIPPAGPLEGGKWEMSSEYHGTHVVSPEAAGIICTSFVMSHLSFKYEGDEATCALLTNNYHSLRDFYSEGKGHPELNAIFAMLD